MSERCPAAPTGSRHVWQFEERPDGTLGKRCVWCKVWYEEGSLSDDRD